MNYNEVANSIVMWIACIPGVAIVVYQAYLFYRKSRQDAIHVGLNEEQVKGAIRAAFATSIGPCFVMLTAMLSLMLYVGAPLAWLRVDFIGSVQYELQSANFAAQGMGLDITSPDKGLDYLSTAAIVMSGGCLGWVIFSGLFSDKMDVVNKKMAGGNEKLVPIIGTGALIGVYFSMSLDRLVPFKYQGFAVIAGGLTMLVVATYNKKANKQWLKEWGLTICMVVGMAVATVIEYTGILG